ncbi:unnamed protein product [marine sediment metagenome]|uniref:Uncharacterized protein n=1 Tax=marine sediment metagenome TaxID=412755 RepID=X1NXZ3_9ZZZZ
MQSLKLSQYRRQKKFTWYSAGTDGKVSGYLIAQLTEVVYQAVSLFFHKLSKMEQALPRLGHGDFSLPSVNETNTQVALQRLNLEGDSGLADRQPFGYLRKAA